jgi:hypothetical protein
MILSSTMLNIGQAVQKNQFKELDEHLTRFSYRRISCIGAQKVDVLRVLKARCTEITGVMELIFSALDNKNQPVFTFAFNELLDDNGRMFAYSAAGHACTLGYLKTEDILPETWFCMALFHGMKDLLTQLCEELDTSTVAFCIANFRQYIPYELAIIIREFHPKALMALQIEPYKNQGRESELELIRAALA